MAENCWKIGCTIIANSQGTSTWFSARATTTGLTGKTFFWFVLFCFFSFFRSNGVVRNYQAETLWPCSNKRGLHASGPQRINYLAGTKLIYTWVGAIPVCGEIHEWLQSLVVRLNSLNEFCQRSLSAGDFLIAGISLNDLTEQDRLFPLFVM